MKLHQILLVILEKHSFIFFLNFTALTLFLISSMVLFTSSVIAQEYETDRIFIRQQSKNHCLVDAQSKIRNMRKTRDMSGEHNQHLNLGVWNLKRTGLQMNQKQQKRLNQLLQGNPGPKYGSARQLQQKRQRRYAAIKQKCRDLTSD